MNRFTFASFAILAVVGTGLMIGLAGCSDSASTTSSTSPSPVSTSPNEDVGDDHDHGDHSHEGHDHQAMKEGLAELSETDQKAAMQQHICPVTEEMLGSMGTPLKVSLENQDVWVCCKGCVKKVTENPEEYLAKLKEHHDHAAHQAGEHGDHNPGE